MRFETLLIGALVVALATGPSAEAATFTVNDRTDRTDADPADGICDADLATPGEQCTLRAAVQQANAKADTDSIILPAGKYRLTLRGPQEDVAAAGDLDITSTVIIMGAGAASTVVEGRKAKDRVFEIRGDATISGITIRKGRALTDSTGGGGIRNHGHLTLTDAVVTRCMSTDDGGGMDVRGGTVTLRNVVFLRNRSGDDAGGIDVDGGTAELTNVVFTRNRAHDEGGGLENSGAVVTLTQCRFEGNRAQTDGGAISNEEGGAMSLSGCFVGGNRAKTGGGISTADTALGPNTTMVRDTTFVKNRTRNCIGVLTSLGGNVDSDGSCGF
jgi:predicted outer membrane repeat protein